MRLNAVVPGLALMLLAATLAAAEFLRPEQAFRPSATVRDATLELRWDIAPGYYLYRDKLKLTSLTPGVTLGEPVWPPAETQEDPWFGTVAIYRTAITVPVPLIRGADVSGELTLEIASQGCATAGFCYPPQRERLTLALPAASTVAKQTATSPANWRTRLRSAPDELLPAAEALRFTAVVAAPDTVRLRWDIAPGTFLYRDEIRLSLEDNAGVTLGPLILPPAETVSDGVRPDGQIGSVARYRTSFEATLPLRRAAPEATEIVLVARFQGCAERGVCYPPVVERVRLALPAVPFDSTLQPRTDAPATRVSPSSAPDRLAARLASGQVAGALALFFGFGVLLALTPCVLPTLPILAGIVAGPGGRGETGRAFRLSLAYVLAMALTYALAGLIVALFGANLQALLQHPLALMLAAALFVALALSLFGFYELQVPRALQARLTALGDRQPQGTLLGAALLGALSALIVGPCVAPPLVGALIFVGQTGDVGLGFLALFALGLGMGAPLLLLGTAAGTLLPRAGAWMEHIKIVFGVLLLAVALALLERLLPPFVALWLWGLLLIACGVFLGALQPLSAVAGGWRLFSHAAAARRSPAASSWLTVPAHVFNPRRPR